MMSASMPPVRKKRNAEVPYRIPIRLWSTVVTQDQAVERVWAALPSMKAALVAIETLGKRRPRNSVPSRVTGFDEIWMRTK
jgi:hypothetical protein